MSTTPLLHHFTTRRMSFWPRTVLLVITLALVLVAPPSFGETGDHPTATDATETSKHIQALLPKKVKKKDCTKASTSAIKTACTWLEKQRQAEDRLQTEVSLGFNGDETSDEGEDQFRLDADISLSQGLYPRSMRFKSGARLRFEEGELEDDVTTFLFNYDYYFEPWLEGWVFTERFSDSFMGIEERYEIGIGLDFERHLYGTKEETLRNLEDTCPPQTAGERGTEQLKRVPRLTRQARLNLTTAVKEFDGASTAQKKTFCEEMPRLLKENARLTVSLGTSILAEFEDPEPFMITRPTRVGPDGESEFRVSPEWRSRWGLRPSLLWRINDDLDFLTRFYVKLPLGDEWRVDGRLDYRLDAHAGLTMALDDRDKVKLTTEVQYHYDAVPPRIPADRLMRLEEQGFEARKAVAEDTHWIYKLQVKVSVGG